MLFINFSKNFGDGNMITNNNKLEKNVKDVQDDKNRKIKIEKKEGRRRGRSGSLSWFYCIPFKINKRVVSSLYNIFSANQKAF